jgi:rSAM/selenodomain-associated transferase 2
MNLSQQNQKTQEIVSEVVPKFDKIANISIIIPTFNEDLIIEKCLSHLQKLEYNDVIFVDGGSQDNTVELIKRNNFKVIKSTLTGRSYQMNLGAAKTSGEILLFLHADTFLPLNYSLFVQSILSQKDSIAGAFRLKIDSDKKIFRLLETMINWRSHFCSLPYGDQAIFLKKSVFEAIGGFPEIPIMEDFKLIKKLQKLGKIRVASESVITSARRWQKLGVFKTTLINQLIILGFYLKINYQTLAKLYRKIK